MRGARSGGAVIGGLFESSLDSETSGQQQASAKEGCTSQRCRQALCPGLLSRKDSVAEADGWRVDWSIEVEESYQLGTVAHPI